jgi:hypothetical protein
LTSSRWHSSAPFACVNPRAFGHAFRESALGSLLRQGYGGQAMRSTSEAAYNRDLYGPCTESTFPLSLRSSVTITR